MSVKKRNDFLISINMDAGNEYSEYNFLMPYKFSQSYNDYLSISGRMIIIKGSRVNKLNVGQVINNHNGEINNQITKALCLYFCTNEIICKINNIKIECDNEKPFSYTSSELNQLTNSVVATPLLNNLDNDSLRIILESTPKGRAYYYALTHLIRALTLENEYDSFEKVWKAFNSIYKEITGKSNDHDCLREMREFILNNSENLPLSMSYCKKLTMAKIREHMTWNKMILNDFPTISNTKAYRDFILRYTDKRIMGIARESTIRNEFLAQKDFLEVVQNHMDNNLKTINDAEIVSILCIKYMYYLRNKTIHGEHIDAGFRVSPSNAPSGNIKWCKKILILLLCDLFNLNR
ncbi:hypothetical protein AHW90_07300 [Salmonella enterica subsp. enterica]|nr:hypothetical protein [Salmonella enterica subsp. enterica]